MKWMALVIVLMGHMTCGTLCAQDLGKTRFSSMTNGRAKNSNFSPNIKGREKGAGVVTEKTISDTQAKNLDGMSRSRFSGILDGTSSRHSMRRKDMKSWYVTPCDSQAYYAHVERRKGWIVGWGKSLAVNETLSLPSYYCLSHPNEHGHWQKVELLCQGKPFTSDALAPYWDCHYPGLTPKAEEWMRQSRSAAIWHQTAGPDGDELLEERACDAQGTLLFTTLYTPLEDNSVNLAFTDRQGFPIDVNPAGREIELEAALDIVHQESFDNTYGTTVLILRDASGRDSLATLRDGQGYLKSRADGVTTLKFIRDSLGRTVYELSLNICDEPVLRRSGFCGWHYEYDGTSNTPTHSVKVGTDLRPLGWAEGKGLTVQSAH